MIWSDEVSVSIVRSNKSLIAAKVSKGEEMKEWMLVEVYGDSN